MDFYRVTGQLIYESPARHNCNLFHGNGGNSMPSESTPVTPVSAVLAQVSI